MFHDGLLDLQEELTPTDLSLADGTTVSW